MMEDMTHHETWSGWALGSTTDKKTMFEHYEHRKDDSGNITGVRVKDYGLQTNALECVPHLN